MFDGRVVQVLDDGLLVFTEHGIESRLRFTGYPLVEGPVVIFLTGYPFPIADDEVVKIGVLKEDGMLQYQTAMGSTKTVRRFKYLRAGTK